MSEELLHSRELGTIVEHIGGKGVAEHMRAQALGMSHTAEFAVHDIVHQLAV